MGILFIISVAALLALLWAAFSTARHVRRARRRQRKAVQAIAEVKREGAKAAPKPGALAQTRVAENPLSKLGGESVSATNDWEQVRYSSSSFTAKHALNRKV